jgi:hypothetical protein
MLWRQQNNCARRRYDRHRNAAAECCSAWRAWNAGQGDASPLPTALVIEELDACFVVSSKFTTADLDDLVRSALTGLIQASAA